MFHIFIPAWNRKVLGDLVLLLPQAYLLFLELLFHWNTCEVGTFKYFDAHVSDQGM